MFFTFFLYAMFANLRNKHCHDENDPNLPLRCYGNFRGLWLIKRRRRIIVPLSCEYSEKNTIIWQYRKSRCIKCIYSRLYYSATECHCQKRCQRLYSKQRNAGKSWLKESTLFSRIHKHSFGVLGADTLTFVSCGSQLALHPRKESTQCRLAKKSTLGFFTW
jgi:hypothetical protein